MTFLHFTCLRAGLLVMDPVLVMMGLPPDGVPVVADDTPVVCAAAAIEHHAAHWVRQAPVWTHDGLRATVCPSVPWH